MASSKKTKYPMGWVVRSKRCSAGLTQDELGTAAGLSQGMLSMVELGSSPNPTLETTCKIADALKIPVQELFQAFLDGRAALKKDREGTSLTSNPGSSDQKSLASPPGESHDAIH